MKKPVAMISVLVLVVVTAVLFLSRKTTGTGKNAPSSLFPDYFVLRNYNPEAKEGIHEMPAQWLSILQGLTDENLVGIRCSERLVDEGDAFFIREYDTHRPTRQVTEPSLAALLKKAQGTTSAPRKILTARLCETDTGKTYLEYTDGLQTYVHPDEGTETKTHLFFGDKTAFTPGLPVLPQAIWPYPGCDAPYALTRDGKLYYGCTIWNETGYTSRYSLIDFQSRTVKELLACTMTFAPTPTRTCREATL